MSEPVTNERDRSALLLLRRQRSHVLFILSDVKAGREAAFLSWYQGAYRNAASSIADIIGVQLYERHEVDITQGRYPPLPFRYLGLHQLSLDGAKAAGGIIDRITQLHREQDSANAPATWLYYPVGEKVGRSPTVSPTMLTVAFANSVVGQEAEFREWYATRHIRHALNVPALVSGQCFERTQFQMPGAMEARFHTIAVYEQEGTSESIIESLNSLPPTTLHFPMLDGDPSRFAEWVYRPIP